MNLMHQLRNLGNFGITVAILIGMAAFMWSSVWNEDLFWHAKNGQIMLQQGSLLTTELFSHTANGEALTVPGWLNDLLTQWVWQTFGDSGIHAAIALTVVLTWYFLFCAVRLFFPNGETAVLISLVGLLLLAPTVSARPYLITNMGFAAVLYFLLHFVRYRSISRLWLLIPMFALWPNLHYGFAVAITLILMFVVSAVADKIIPLSNETPLAPILSGQFFLIVFAAIVAAGANPYGLSIYPELWQLTLRAKNSVVAEWYSPVFRGLPSLIILGTIFVYIYLLFLLKSRVSWLVIFVPTFFMFAFLTASRNIAFWIMVFIVFSAMIAAKTIIIGNWINQSSPNTIESDTQGKLSIWGFHLVILALAFTGLFLTRPVLEQRVQQAAADTYPLDATAYLLKSVPGGRLFNEYVAGGYLLWKAYPKFQVFIDGRFIPYSDEIMNDYRSIMNGEPNALSLIDQYGIEILVFPVKKSLNLILKLSPKHRLIYRDKNHVIYVVDSPKFSTLSMHTPSRNLLGNRVR